MSGRFAAGAQVGEHRVDALLVDQAQRRVGDAQAHPAVPLKPEAAVCRFGGKRRLVLLFAYETLLPTIGAASDLADWADRLLGLRLFELGFELDVQSGLWL